MIDYIGSKGIIPLTGVKHMDIDTLEKKIYDTFYDNGGEDARFELWPDVLEAKKAKFPIEELEQILDIVTNNVGQYL